MSHRRVHSQGSEIPFSWEDKPGVSKVTNQDCPTETGFHALNFLSEDSGESPKPKALDNHEKEMKIPPPPCPLLKAPSRSSSARGLKWQQADPFLLAYKVCTQSTSTLNIHNSGNLPGQNKKNFGYRVRKSKFNMFSCKNSCDVRDDNFVKLSQLPPLPPLPRDRSRSYLDEN